MLLVYEESDDLRGTVPESGPQDDEPDQAIPVEAAIEVPSTLAPGWNLPGLSILDANDREMEPGAHLS
jgi:hypothetical protein